MEYDFSSFNICGHSDSKTIQNVHKLHEEGVIWNHSEVFLKQKSNAQFFCY